MKSVGALRFHFAVVNTGLIQFHPVCQGSIIAAGRMITFIGWWPETGLALLKCAMRSHCCLSSSAVRNIATPRP